MSTYREDKTQIKDRDLFEQVFDQICQERGIVGQKAKEGEMVRMAYGNRCEFMVPRKFLGTMDDLGWRWSERDGCMVAVSTAHSLGAVKSKEIQNDIQRRYAETWLNRELQKPAFRKYRKRIKRDERGRVTQVVLS